MPSYVCFEEGVETNNVILTIDKRDDISKLKPSGFQACKIVFFFMLWEQDISLRGHTMKSEG